MSIRNKNWYASHICAMIITLTLAIAESDSLPMADVADAADEQNQRGPQAAQFRGLWAPAIAMEGAQSMDDPVQLRMAGFNTVSVVAPVLVDAFGSLSTPLPMATLSRKIASLHQHGLGTFLSLELIYAPDGTLRTARFDAPLPPSLVQLQGHALLAAYRFQVWRYARLAEAEHVTLFAPINEPDLRLGEASRQWSQPLLLTAGRVYQGRLVWKADADLELDLRGYDGVGISLFSACDLSLEAFQAQVAARLVELVHIAEVNQVPITLVSEFGNASSCAGRRTDYETSRVADIVLEEGQRRGLTGYFVFDPPFLTDLAPLRGTPQEEAVSRWYLSRL